MCHRVQCPTCGLATWSGCGQHIEAALAGVPAAERCQCDAAPSTAGGGFFRKLLGR
jgi:hypothetical protein